MTEMTNGETDPVPYHKGQLARWDGEEWAPLRLEFPPKPPRDLTEREADDIVARAFGSADRVVTGISVTLFEEALDGTSKSSFARYLRSNKTARLCYGAVSRWECQETRESPREVYIRCIKHRPRHVVKAWSAELAPVHLSIKPDDGPCEEAPE